MENEVSDSGTIQSFLRNPPAIIWGSGATVALGLPTMGDLNDALDVEIEGFDGNNENLEAELGKPEYESKMPEIRDVVWRVVNEADLGVLESLIDGDVSYVHGIKTMVEKFREAHPQVVNIVTTNYDRVLEYVMGYYGIPFNDGFDGVELSKFDSRLFQKTNNTNIVKVHGSLSWFQVGSSIRCLRKNNEDADPVIIPPGKNKYKEAYKAPYRELIQKSDDLINGAPSFLVVGFGFNDEHLTPKIKEKVSNGTPLVLITKDVTESCISELRDAQKYIFLQQDEPGNTKVQSKTGEDNMVKESIIEGDYWKLDKFMEIL